MPLVRDSQCLAPENSTALELALERLTRRLEDVPVPLRDLWRPDTCPIELLPWLAYALSIDSWNPTWSESVKRNVVAAAIEIQRKKGTAASVRQVVGEGGQPATARFVEEVIDEVIRTKPVRAHFTFTQGLAAQGGLGLAAAARAADFYRLQLEAA